MVAWLHPPISTSPAPQIINAWTTRPALTGVVTDRRRDVPLGLDKFNMLNLVA